MYSPSKSVEYCDQGTGKCKETSFFLQSTYIHIQHTKRPNTPSHAKLKRFERVSWRYNQLRSTCLSTPFILGGSKAAGKEFPFMARMGRRIPTIRRKPTIKWECVGTLIHSKLVLTAVHCLFSAETKKQILKLTFPCPKFVVRLGKLDLSSFKDEAQPQDFGVDNYVPHPYDEDHNDDSRHYDIALIKLLLEATINEYISPACVPMPNWNRYL